MRSKLSERVMALGLAISVCGASHVGAVTLQPDESNSQDVFTYQFGVGNLFNIDTSPRTTNLDANTLATEHPESPVGILLATSKSDPTNPSDVTTGHSANTLIRFDVSGVGMTAGDVAQATLNLYVLDGAAVVEGVPAEAGGPGGPAFGNPSATTPVSTSLYEAGQSWDETTVTWETEPARGPLVDTQVQDFVSDWVSYDVTDVVKGWLDGTKENHGLILEQDEVVVSELAATNVVASLYPSASFSDPSIRPFLEITPVPEPASWGMLAVGVGMVLRRSRARTS